jgi:hypothetical protein
VLVITVLNASGASPPTVNGLVATLRAVGRLRDYPAGSEPSTARSGQILGDFGPGFVRISRLEARDDALRQPNVSVGDTLLLGFSILTDRYVVCVCVWVCVCGYGCLFCVWVYMLFSSLCVRREPDTNRSFRPDIRIHSSRHSTHIHTYIHIHTVRGGIPTNQTLDKAKVDQMFAFSSPLAQNYSGAWFNSTLFIITVLSAPQQSGPFGAYVPSPIISDLTVSILETANLRNFPPTSAPSVTTSVPLSGGFGPSVVYIVSLVGDDPDDGDIVYGAEDTITVTFNRETNMAGMPLGFAPKSEVIVACLCVLVCLYLCLYLCLCLCLCFA